MDIRLFGPEGAQLASTEAIRLYRGAYLEDEPYAPWTEEPRRCFERAYLDLLVVRAELAMGRGEFQDGLELAEQAL